MTTDREAREALRARLRRMTKPEIIAILRRGVRKPDGTRDYTARGISDREYRQWTKEDLIISISFIRYPVTEEERESRG